MTEIMGDLDFSVLEVLDFDESLPCEVPGGCDEAAAWKIVTGCCGEVVLICEKHKKICVDDPLEYVQKHPTTRLECNYCGRKNMKISKFLFIVDRI